MTRDELQKLGYQLQPDGSYSRRPAPPRLPNPEPQPHHQPALDETRPREEKGARRTLLVITRRSSRLLDADNFAGGCKPLIDQLRYARLIPDDDPESVEITFRQEKVGRGEEGTTVKILKP